MTDASTTPTPSPAGSHGTGPFIAAIDQGTTSSRCIVFDRDGRIVAVDQKEHQQIFPKPGWVEHDAAEIWANVQEVVAGAVAKAGQDVPGFTPGDVKAIGITNQRETTLLWDRHTGEPVHNALVWQDTRTDALCRELGRTGGQDRFRATTGLPLASYFAGPKIRWLLDNVEGLRERAEAGDILFGTMDSWVIWNLTGGPDGGVHVTDVTNASRTLLMDLRTLDWDQEILDAIGVPAAVLPRIGSSSEVYGTTGVGGLDDVPVASALGDQQAALFGQTCFAQGEAKSTYGTGTFMLMNTGDTPVDSHNGLITTVGYRIGEQPPVYALEGSIAVTGSLVQWMRDQMGLISTAAEIETLALTVEDNGGAYFVPAFSGLFAPYWRDDARGVIAGLTRYVTKAHIARAVLEATAWQTREIADAMTKDSGVELAALKVDGGMTSDNLLMQTLADVLDAPVVRPMVAETTCLGAAYAAGLAVGFWPDTDALRANWRRAAEWTPGMDAAVRDREYRNWLKAVERTMGWIDDEPEPQKNNQNAHDENDEN
ncbi:glycerol kinase GlpK [Actinacidiphila yeochonensis]|uniref:glycerol kinase GlpK n=1 Tax=Actinacidiphila yeochonensis TaxID=89050 RepID=UPI000689F1A8|nr:glycerol kinase GlpK [Actinacidiphila yeochonensis]